MRDEYGTEYHKCTNHPDRWAVTNQRGGVRLCVECHDYLNPAHNYGADPWRAPPVGPGEVVTVDECGRVWQAGRNAVCGRSHWFRIVRDADDNRRSLLVKHGGGVERFRLRHHGDALAACIEAMPDSLTRYHACWAVFDLARDMETAGRETERARWCKAVQEGRVKKRRRGAARFVEIVP